MGNALDGAAEELHRGCPLDILVALLHNQKYLDYLLMVNNVFGARSVL